MALGQLAKFLLRKARLLFAFLDVASTCAFQVKLSAMVTPWYLQGRISVVFAGLVHCQVVTMYCVGCLDGISFPCYHNDLTFTGVERHLPIPLPLL